jgi:hypothetical protein
MACPTVMYVNVCSKKGVQLRLLLLLLELGFLCVGLGWLELRMAQSCCLLLKIAFAFE